MAGNEDAALELPRWYGKYQLLERIGVGGMAEVFKARLPGVAGFEKTLVVKRLQTRFAQDPRLVQMFIDEAKLAAEVQHKNVVQVFELGQGNGELHIAMEYVAGNDLNYLLRAAARRKTRLPTWLSLHVVAEILEALAYAHNLRDGSGRPRNIVHCDVTPENIFVSQLGDVKLGDFGVALDDARGRPEGGHIQGKIPYMSPEQVTGKRPDGRADVFAAAIVLWECLAERRLFSAATRQESMSRICVGTRPPPSRYAPDIPNELDHLVLAALDPDPARRPQSARAFQEELLAILTKLMPRVRPTDVTNSVAALLALSEKPEPRAPSAPQATGGWVRTSSASSPPPVTATDFVAEPNGLEQVFAGLGTRPPEPTPDPLKTFQYAIIKPKNAIERIGAIPSSPMPGRPGNLETGDLMRTHAPIAAAPSRVETGDVLRSPAPAAEMGLWLRFSNGGVMGPLPAHEALSLLQRQLQDGDQGMIQIAADRRRWLDLKRFMELLGELPMPAAHLPATDFVGTTQTRSLTFVLGWLARNGATGQLHLARQDEAPEHTVVHLDGGRLTAVAASQTMLSGLITMLDDPTRHHYDLAEALAESVVRDRSLDTLLRPDVSRGLRESRARIMQRVFLESFAWSHVRYVFDPSTPPRSGLGTPLPILRLLPGLVARTYSAQALTELLHPALDWVLARNPSFDQDLAALSLPSIENNRAQVFGGGRTLAESLALTGALTGEKPPLVVAYLLLELGALRAATPVR